MKNNAVPSAASVEFSTRFGLEDWQRHCANPKFLAAVESGDFESAEAIAWLELNDEINSPGFKAGVAAQVEREKLHAVACDFVRTWARLTNRNGSEHKQARQCRIRKLMRHGMNSDYARKLAQEAGLL